MTRKSFLIILGTLLFLSAVQAQWDFDMATTQILAPIDTVHLGDSLYPRAKIKNVGNVSAWPTFYVIFTIDNFYADTVAIATRIDPGQEVTVYFRRWGAGSLGTFEVKCSTAYSLDQNTSNDKKTDTIFIVPPPISYWLKLSEVVPTSPDGKLIKNGGGLVATESKIFIIKGNGTKSFYSYIPGSQPIWIDSVRISTKKGIKKGCAMVYDGTRYIYIACGTNTHEFLRYDTQSASWTQLKPVPEGPTGTALKGGTGIAYADSSVYLLKGTKTTEFYRFDIAHDSWEKLRNAPAVIDAGKGYGAGSCLVSDSNYIYALRGKYNEFYKYYPEGDSWSNLKSLPMVHPMVKRSKKVGDGAAMTLRDGNIYTLKGKNTKEFWMYDQLIGDWIFKDTMQKGSEKKYVKGGGSLCTFNGTIYAIKGNKTNVIYQYLGINKANLPQPNISSTRLISFKEKENGIMINPNPTRSSAKVYFSLPAKDIKTVTVYNIFGKMVQAGKAKQGFFEIMKLTPGIYIIRFESGSRSYKVNEKLIVLK